MEIPALFVAIKFYFLGTYLARVEAPVAALIVFIAVEAAAWDPLAILESALVDGADSGPALALGRGGKQNTKALADTEELVGAGGHHETIAGFGVRAEDGIERDVHGVSAHSELSVRVLAIEDEPVDVSSGLVLENQRSDGLDGAIADGKVLLGIHVVFDREWREAKPCFFANSVKDVGGAGS